MGPGALVDLDLVAPDGIGPNLQANVDLLIHMPVSY